MGRAYNIVSWLLLIVGAVLVLLAPLYPYIIVPLVAQSQLGTANLSNFSNLGPIGQSGSGSYTLGDQIQRGVAESELIGFAFILSGCVLFIAGLGMKIAALLHRRSGGPKK